MSHKIEVANLSKVFGDEPEQALEMIRSGRSKQDVFVETGQTVGVQDVNFSVEEGEIFVVMGLSGSGKSTLVRMLNRLIPASAGSVTLDGQDLVAADEATLRDLRLRKIAMVFQHFALFPHKTVRENVEYGLKVQGVSRRERREKALRALENVGLDAWADSRPQELSGGMQQRVGLARGLAVDPEILLMDEPFSALDPLIRRDMQAELIALQRKLKKTIVFITHDLLEALTLGDRIAIMKEGRFVQVGTAEEIVAHPADDYVAEFTADIDRSRVFTAGRIAEEPLTVDPAAEDVAGALAALDRAERDALHLLEDGRPAGVLTRDALLSAKAEGRSDLAPLVIRDVPTATEDSHLYKLFRSAAGGLPVAVVDGDGRMTGVVTARSLFAHVAPDEGRGDRGDDDDDAEETRSAAA